MPPPFLLTVSVQNGPRDLVPQTFARVDSVWAAENTCMQWLEKLLREHDQCELAAKLPECNVGMKCRRPSHGTAPVGFKRPRPTEMVVASLFLNDSLADTLAATESDELFFLVTPPARQAPVRDATTLIMRASTSRRLPDRKSFKRMTGEHELYNTV